MIKCWNKENFCLLVPEENYLVAFSFCHWESVGKRQSHAHPCVLKKMWDSHFDELHVQTANGTCIPSSLPSSSSSSLSQTEGERRQERGREGEEEGEPIDTTTLPLKHLNISMFCSRQLQTRENCVTDVGIKDVGKQLFFACFIFCSVLIFFFFFLKRCLVLIWHQSISLGFGTFRTNLLHLC